MKQFVPAAALALAALASAACVPNAGHADPPFAPAALTADSFAPARAATPTLFPTLSGNAPLVIAHRGASGVRPEHTEAAYREAIAQGADCIEPDLVVSKDGHLIDRHDVYLSTTTDVAARPEFASRKRKADAGEAKGREDWFTQDFTLAELKTLKARQPFAGRSKEHDGQFGILTFDEVLAIVAAENAARAGKQAPLCVYPEAKDPALFASLGHDPGGLILAALKRHGMDGAGAPVFIQSFDPAFIKAMRPRTPLPLVMLVSTPADLAAARAVAGEDSWNGLGVYRAMLTGADGAPSGLVKEAHAARKFVHVWTYRDDAPFSATETPAAALARDIAMGVDGVFADFPASAVQAVRRHVQSQM